MELYEFVNKVSELVGVEVEQMPEAFMEKVLGENEAFFDDLKSLHDDLTTDHLHIIWQTAKKRCKTIRLPVLDG